APQQSHPESHTLNATPGRQDTHHHNRPDQALLVARLNFDDADDLVNVELITEPVEVNRYAQARDAATHYAVPYEEFAARLAASE
ncbi:DUF6879 family protein, partial [Streptomyces sp. AK02-04a]|uniref:DUF6879 family protein n=1 Tax=Streptomyces sp. AK02-04a TaxID=3028649 RepID=UPI0029B9B27B|nr:hypothetical protein [Streptomyces sp. AK02-04a]